MQAHPHTHTHTSAVPPLAYLCHIYLWPGDVGERSARLDKNLGEMVVVVTGGYHMQAHKNVEGKGKDRKIPAAVDRG